MTGPADAPAALGRKPRDDEIDVYGLTHPGKVRKENQDHFLICSLTKHVDVHLTSLPDPSALQDYFEARRLLALRGEDNIRSAISTLQRVLDRRPEFSQASRVFRPSL